MEYGAHSRLLKAPSTLGSSLVHVVPS
uniref:Uncharacterized protein n=1 Tax=Anguilla anguilla TaxID=7936 RepID=A0A0E9QA06_ANGAN